MVLGCTINELMTTSVILPAQMSAKFKDTLSSEPAGLDILFVGREVELMSCGFQFKR